MHLGLCGFGIPHVLSVAAIRAGVKSSVLGIEVSSIYTVDSPHFWWVCIKDGSLLIHSEVALSVLIHRCPCMVVGIEHDNAQNYCDKKCCHNRVY